jgi:hypothetical protein
MHGDMNMLACPFHCSAKIFTHHTAVEMRIRIIMHFLFFFL